MTSPTTTLAANQQPGQVDLEALKARQQGAWSSGNYAIVGTTLQIVGEDLCEALDVRSGQKVLDVAAGNGNVTLAAARRWCNVVSTDYVPSLLEQSSPCRGRRLVGRVRACGCRGAGLCRSYVRRGGFNLRRHVYTKPGQNGWSFQLRRPPIAGRSRCRNRLRTVWRKTQADLRNKSNLSQSFSATVGSS
jgi:hypothetical protein